MDITEKVLEIMREQGQPLNAGKITEIGGLDRKEVDKATKRPTTTNVQAPQKALNIAKLSQTSLSRKTPSPVCHR